MVKQWCENWFEMEWAVKAPKGEKFVFVASTLQLPIRLGRTFHPDMGVEAL